MGGQAACAGNVIPVDAIDAERTQRAMESMRHLAPVLWITVHCRWVGDPRVPAGKRRPMSMGEAAASLVCSERTVLNRIDAGLLFVATALSVRN
jgi:hypothetical protein